MPNDWDDPTEFFDDEFAELGTINGVDKMMIAYKKEQSEQVIDAGARKEVDFKIMGMVADFTPVEDGELTFPKGGTTYRIDSFTKDSTGKTWLISLKDKPGVST